MCWRTAIKAAFTPDAMTHFSSPIFISNICGSSEISPGFLPGGREISPDQKHSSTKIKVCHFKKDKKNETFQKQYSLGNSHSTFIFGAKLFCQMGALR